MQVPIEIWIPIILAIPGIIGFIFYLMDRYKASRLRKAKSVVDIEFKYEVINYNSKKYLLGKITAENKRDYDINLLSMGLKLEAMRENPKILFYNEQTKQFESKLDVMETESIRKTFSYWSKHPEITSVAKAVIQTTEDIIYHRLEYYSWSKMVENFEFVVEIQGTGFFILYVGLQSAPLRLGKPYKYYYAKKLYEANIEVFNGYVV